jgi:hypothetical protein
MMFSATTSSIKHKAFSDKKAKKPWRRDEMHVRTAAKRRSFYERGPKRKNKEEQQKEYGLITMLNTTCIT